MWTGCSCCNSGCCCLFQLHGVWAHEPLLHVKELGHKAKVASTSPSLPRRATMAVCWLLCSSCCSLQLFSTTFHPSPGSVPSVRDCGAWGVGSPTIPSSAHQRSGQNTCSRHRALACLTCHDCFFIHQKMLSSRECSGACRICSSVSCSVWVSLGGINKVNSMRFEAVCSALRMWILPALAWQSASEWAGE